MKLATILSVVVAVILGLATWYYSQLALRLEKERDDLRNMREGLQVRVKNLDQEKAILANRLEEQIASSSKAKEQEIDRLKATYDTLMADMKTEIEQGQVTITKLADRLSVSMVDRILFPSGEADITAAGLKVLLRVGNVLKKVEKKVIRVAGHTDNVPISGRLADRFPTNWELSTARASNVVRFLQENVAIDATRLEAVGLSEFHPVAGNATVQGRSQNRRIEIALLPDLREVSTSAK
jgi:chemotaxis protein MotB